MIVHNSSLNNAELEQIISKSRLSTYDGDIAKYIWNKKLSENFFLLLQSLEVGLRNSICYSFKKHYPDQEFFYIYETNLKQRYLGKKEFHSRECWKMLCAVKHKLSKVNSNFTDEDIIAELNFGFWTKLLLDKHYHNMWRKILYDAFPNIEKTSNIDHNRLHISMQNI